MIIARKWEMPNRDTFSIKCISELIDKYNSGTSIDPFAKDSKKATHTNDIDKNTTASTHMDALKYLKTFSSAFADCILFDPPYSPRQVSECYKNAGVKVNMQTTQSSFWSKIKKEISRVVKPCGYVITFGWNSGGVGKKYGFEIVEILLIAHGGWHNDTICTVEQKLR